MFSFTTSDMWKLYLWMGAFKQWDTVIMLLGYCLIYVNVLFGDGLFEWLFQYWTNSQLGIAALQLISPSL